VIYCSFSQTFHLNGRVPDEGRGLSPF